MTAAKWPEPHWVYEFTDAAGAYVYIGCTHAPAQRISNHRTKDWWWEVAHVSMDLYPDQRAGLDEERRRIELHAPKYNTVFTDRYDGGGWTGRRARMAEAHEAGKLCEDSTCREGCAERGHALGVACRRHPYCSVCREFMPREFYEDEQAAACWSELARRYGGYAASEYAWCFPTPLDALEADEAGISIEDATDLPFRDLMQAVSTRRLAQEQAAAS